MSSNPASKTQNKLVPHFSGESRNISTEKHRNGAIRIWWGAWAATIVKAKKVRYNHLHDLTFFSCKGGEKNPRCRCGAIVPEELVQMSLLQRLGVADG